MNDSTLVRVTPRGPAETMHPDKAGRRLTLLSAAERRYCEPLLRGFAERHPEIDVDFVFGISTDLHRRYLQEAASGGATSDLIWSSAMDQVMDLVLSGHAQPHGVRHTLPSGAAYRDLAVATTCEPLFTLCRDPSRPAGSPAEIAALHRDRPATLSRRHRGPGYRDQRPGLPGDAALERGSRVRRFPGCAGIVSAARRGLGARARRRGDGRAELAIHLLGAYALRAVAANPSLHIAPSSAPAMAVSRVAFIPRRAANPEAASAFLAYLLSPEGQAAIGEAGLFPIATPPAFRVAPIPLDESFARLLAPQPRAALLRRWRAALGRHDNNTGGTNP